MESKTDNQQQPEQQLEKYNKAIQQSRAEMLRQRDLAVFKDVIDNKQNEKVPEIVFKEYFADYLYNHEYEKDGTKLTQWLGLTGGWYNECDLVNEKGEVVETVPGFYKRLDIEDAFSDVNFSNIVHTYNRKKDRIAAVAEEYATTAMEDSRRKAITDETTNTHEARWNAVLEKYRTKDTKLPTSDEKKIEPKLFRKVSGNDKLQLDMDDDD